MQSDNMSAPQPIFDLAAEEVGARLKVRELQPGDALQLAVLRLEALQNEGELFGPLFETEDKLTDADWKARASPSGKSTVFGLFDNNKLVGMMTAKPWEGDPSGRTVLWCQAYVSPSYRGNKYAKPLYMAREEWSRERYDEAVCFIHELNKHSQEIHERNGAVRVRSEIMHWPGRSPSNWHWYSKKLG